MGTSNLEDIDTIMRHVLSINPVSVLDVGIGFGKYGFLCREYLQTLKSGVEDSGINVRQNWKHKIVGIEIYPEYVQRLQKEIYDLIFYGDAHKVLDRFKGGSFGLGLAIDVVEHMENWYEFLCKFSVVCNNCIIAFPNGYYYQDGSTGNEYEAHVVHFDDKLVRQIEGMGFYILKRDQKSIVMAR